MSRSHARPAFAWAFSLMFATLSAGCDEAPALDGSRFMRFPDRREACAARDPYRRPFFGDLHVHTNLSFDAASAQVRNDPDAAYRFAKGETVPLPPYDMSGNATRYVKLERPLDFTAVTDHSEFLAETSICLDPTALGYDSESCLSYRAGMAGGQGDIGQFVTSLVFSPPQRQPFCTYDSEPYCQQRLRDIWEGVAATAEAHDDRTSNCSFSTFVAYEWSGSIAANNWHRNVIFGTSTVPRIPYSFIEAWTPDRLWDVLHSECLDAGVGCDVLTIPHNSNISSGRMFNPVDDMRVPYDAKAAARRRALEPLVEIYQHKGSSECTPGLGPMASTDESCRFELVVPDVCTGGPGDSPNCVPLCTANAGGGFLGACVQPSDFVRGSLRTGLSEWARTGENPFAFGFIGSTDTHNGTPGATSEATWQGHVGVQDADPHTRVRADSSVIVVSRYSSPGGLAVVWSEENSRPSLFAAMRRRETYGTSGTRIVLRFFGGYGLDPNLCASSDLVEQGYAKGVPMGSDLPETQSSGIAPSFVLHALADAGSTGTPLQRIEIVKGWYDGTTTHEKVFVVGGDPNNGASVDPQTCVQTGSGASSLCSVWTDPEFDPAQPAFYYARVVENPSCRWHRYVCNQLAVDCASVTPTDPDFTCCDPAFPGDVQERAWSSPIWYYPTTAP